MLAIAEQIIPAGKVIGKAAKDIAEALRDLGKSPYEQLSMGVAGGNPTLANMVDAKVQSSVAKGELPDGVASSVAKVPGRVQSRINISNDGWAHTLNGHFNPSRLNKSQFTISQDELKSLLSDKSIIQSPARQLDTGNFGRTITLDRQIGHLAEKWGGGSTNTFSIVTDYEGNLLTDTPGNL